MRRKYFNDCKHMTSRRSTIAVEIRGGVAYCSDPRVVIIDHDNNGGDGGTIGGSISNSISKSLTIDQLNDGSIDETIVKERKNQKKERKHQISAEEIYALYPRKVGRAAAIKAIQRALKKCDADELVKAVSEFASIVRDYERRFIPHPATWFNQERWADDRREWRAQYRKSDEKRFFSS